MDLINLIISLTLLVQISFCVEFKADVDPLTGENVHRKRKVIVIKRVRKVVRTQKLPPREPLKQLKTNYIINNEDLCTSDTDIFIWVHTAPAYIRKRQALRDTWGNPKSDLIKYNIKMAFFMGASKDEKLQKLVNYENDLYKDIVQEDYIDDYRNMSYKAISGTRWIKDYCSMDNIKLIIKTDDDAIVDTPLLVKYLHKIQPDRGIALNNTILCRVFEGGFVQRGRRNKWATSLLEYSEPQFPPYCQGLAVVLSPDVIPRMYENAVSRQILWIDDVWMFGIVPTSINATFHHFEQKTSISYRTMLDSIVEAKFLFYHIHSQDVFRGLYDRLVHRISPTSLIPSIK